MKHNILLIDDKEENLYSLESLLTDDDRFFYKALNGEDGLRIALTKPISLIMLDVQMPNMDGFEVNELLKMNSKTKDIPVIFVTAIDHNIDYNIKGLESGAIDFLFKPLNGAITRAKVKNILNQVTQKELLAKANKSLNKLITDLQYKNKELEGFAYMIAHDLKAPTHNINTILDLIVDDLNEASIEDDTLQMINMAGFSIKKMQKLIDDLLMFSTTITNVTSKENLNLKEIVDDITALLNLPKNVEIKSKNLDHSIFFEKIALSQSLQNIISNAIKYNDKEKCVISINYDSTKNLISIKDNGPGIRIEESKKIFELFYKTNNESTGDSGTGIGLSLVKKLIERNNSKIYLNEYNNEGAEFIIEISDN